MKNFNLTYKKGFSIIMQFKSKIFILLIFIVVTFIVVILQNKKAEENLNELHMKIPVVGFKARKQSIAEKMDFVGSLEANEMVEIKSEVEGTIEKISFSQGQHVKKGDVLILFNQQRLRASLQQAEANLKLSESVKNRYEPLIQNGAISRLELDQATNSVEVNQAMVEAARVELNSATISAQFDGVMGQRLVSEGQFISRGESLSFIISQGLMKVNFRVPEKYLSQLQEGQTVEVKVESYPTDQFIGEIIFIDPKIDELSRTILVTAKVANSEGKLRQGMFANLSITFNDKNEAIVVPETALIFEGNNILVYTVSNDGKVETKSISTGIHFEGLVEVTKGINEGEMVIIEGYQKITPTSVVKLRFENEQD